MMNKKIIDRFKEKISKKNSTGCIHWLGGGSGGYGSISINNKNQQAHRLSYELFVKKIPKGKCVLHKCDNRKCVNPDHLFLGTIKDNNIDRSKKGRNTDQKGSKHPLSKLKEKDVIKIRKLYSQGNSQEELSILFNVSPSCIGAIIVRRNWKHI